MIVFSGYWHVEGNTKPSADIGHIASARKKRYDVFFCEEEHGMPFEEHILKYEDLDIHSMGLKKYPHQIATTKHGFQMKSDAFDKLKRIWLNKIFLFKTVADMYPEEDNFMWTDCVHSYHADDMMLHRSDKCTVSVRLPAPEQPYGTEETFPSKHFIVAGCSIKMHRNIINEFIMKFMETILNTNSKTVHFDEEYILTEMYIKNKQLFHIINEESISWLPHPD